jgi:hypothetical protein
MNVDLRVFYFGGGHIVFDNSKLFLLDPYVIGFFSFPL